MKNIFCKGRAPWKKEPLEISRATVSKQKMREIAVAEGRGR
jgi:hypothetical protein